jgi:hypothetical protein
MKSLLFGLMGVLSLPLSGNVVTIAANAENMTSLEDTFCQQSATGPVTCEMTYIFVNGPWLAGGSSKVIADFGSVTAFITLAFSNANASVYYQGSFGDNVTVLGGSGNGTLVSHYHLISVDTQDGLPGLAVPPSYRFLQGATAIDYTPDLPQPFNNRETSVLMEDLDVSSPVVFGVPLMLAAGSSTQLHTVLQPGGFMLTTNSSLTLTGYTVLDSTGTVVGGATVQREFALVPDVYAPESKTVWYSIAGVAVISVLRRLRRREGGHRAQGDCPGMPPRAVF